MNFHLHTQEIDDQKLFGVFKGTKLHINFQFDLNLYLFVDNWLLCLIVRSSIYQLTIFLSEPVNSERTEPNGPIKLWLYSSSLFDLRYYSILYLIFNKPQILSFEDINCLKTFLFVLCFWINQKEWFFEIDIKHH